MTMYLDINILQSVPASNINRDDTGAPKTVIYGGALRSRVSSQAWKRATRIDFNQHLTKDDEYSLRTRYVPEMLAHEYEILHDDLDHETALDQAAKICDKVGFKTDTKTGTPILKTLLMVTPNEIHELALATDEYRENPKNLKSTKDLKKILKVDHPLDRALFGRMVAADPTLNIDAAVQVAHAVSVNEIQREYDYFTAVDDSPSATGAGMIDTIDYNSSTLFRYANINLDKLLANTGSIDAALAGIKRFLKSFTLSMPTGHETTFANKTIPQYVMFTLRDDTPVNLVSAFENPIASHHGYIDEAIERFETEFTNAEKMVDPAVLTTVITAHKTQLDDADHEKNLTYAIDTITDKIAEELN